MLAVRTIFQSDPLPTERALGVIADVIHREGTVFLHHDPRDSISTWSIDRWFHLRRIVGVAFVPRDLWRLVRVVNRSIWVHQGLILFRFELSR